MTTFYLSGPMRGKPMYNRAQFIEVEQALRKAAEPGDQIINPSLNFNGDQSLEPSVYMTLDLHQVLDSDVVVLLPGWQDSPGARREIQLAMWAGKDFMEAEAKPLADGDWTYEFFEPVEDIPAMDDNPSLRVQVLNHAKGYITGDRNNNYGPPHQDFRRSSDAMTAYGYRHTMLPASAPACPTCHARPMASYDTAIMVDCIKTSRIMWTPTKQDHWDDKAGYAACGYECAVEDAKAAALPMAVILAGASPSGFPGAIQARVTVSPHDSVTGPEHPPAVAMRTAAECPAEYEPSSLAGSVAP